MNKLVSILSELAKGNTVYLVGISIVSGLVGIFIGIGLVRAEAPADSLLFKDSWLLSGISAGAFAAFFTWSQAFYRDKRHMSNLLLMVSIEVFGNYNRLVFQETKPTNLNDGVPFFDLNNWYKLKYDLAPYLTEQEFECLDTAYAWFKVLPTYSSALYTTKREEAKGYIKQVISMLNRKTGIERTIMSDKEIIQFYKETIDLQG